MFMSILANRWHCLSEPTVESVLLVSHSCFHHDSRGFLPSVASVTVSSVSPILGGHLCFLLSLKVWLLETLHVCLENKDGVSTEHVAIISRLWAVFLSDCLPECVSVCVCVCVSVSPHMGLFLAGGNCALVCVLAGVGTWRRAPEKTGRLLSWKENIVRHNSSFVLQRETVNLCRWGRMERLCIWPYEDMCPKTSGCLRFTHSGVFSACSFIWRNACIHILWKLRASTLQLTSICLECETQPEETGSENQ